MGKQYFNPPGVPPGGQPDGDPSAPPRGPTPPPPVPPAAPEGRDQAELARQLRAVRRELTQAEQDLAREREQLDRVRQAVAAQRLTHSAQQEQLDRERAELAAERQRVETLLADAEARQRQLEDDYRRRHAELEAGLGRRQAELADQVAELEMHHAGLDEEVARRLGELERRVAEGEAELARRIGQADAALARRVAETDAELASRVARTQADLDEQARRQREELRQARELAEQRDFELREQTAAELAERTAAAEATSARLLAEARAELANARGEAERLRTQAEREATAMRQAAETEIDVQRSMFQSQRQSAEIELAQRREQFEADVAAFRQRIARIDADEARIAAEKTRLGEQRKAQDKKALELDRRESELAEQQTVVRSQRERLDQRQVELDQAERRVAEVGRSLADGRAELDRQQADLVSREQAVAANQADLDRRAREVVESERAMAARQEQLDARAEQVAQDVLACETELRQLREQQESLNRQRTANENLARTLAAREAALQETERDVLTGWEDVRKAQSAISETQERLVRDRLELNDQQKRQAAPPQPPAPAPVVVQAISRKTFVRWAASLAAMTVIALVVVEAMLFGWMAPRYRAAGQMHFNVTRPDGQSASRVALTELANFLRESGPDDELDAADDRLEGPHWQIRVADGAGRADSTSLLVQAEGRSADDVAGRVNALMRGYYDWRDRKLAQAELSGSLNDLYNQRTRLQAESAVMDRAEQAARAAVIEGVGLDAALARHPAGDVLTQLDREFADRKQKAAAATQELQRIVTDRVAWTAELAQLHAEGPLADEDRIAQIERDLALDRGLIAQHAARIRQTQSAADAALAAAHRQWTLSSKRLAAALSENDRTDAPAVREANREFETARLAYEDALARANPDANPLLRTLRQTVAELEARSATRQSELAALSAGRRRSARVNEIEELLADSELRAERLREQVQQLSAAHTRLAGDLTAYRALVERVEQTRGELRRVNQQIGLAEGLTQARIRLAFTAVSPEQAERLDRRAQIMPAAAAGVVLVFALLGWLALVLLTRPPRRDAQQDASAVVEPGVN